MSLYIGNLSPRVRKDELERVFRRFGRCTIQLKDGYGFAVYGIRAHAEMALRALRGRNICGVPISLSWSNKQPTSSLQTFIRGARSYEMQHGRGFDRRDDHISGPSRPNAHRHYKFRQPYGEAGRVESNYLHVERGSFDHDYEEQEHNNQKEDCQDRSDNADHDLLDSGRWGEQIGRLSNDSHIDDGATFDRYEPDRDYEKTDQEGSKAILRDMSPGREISENKFRREEAGDVAVGHDYSPRKNQACFSCGNLGHKMRDCPLQDTSRKRKLDYSNDRWGSEVNNRHRDRSESEGAGPSSRRRLSSTSTRQQVSGRKDSGSGRHERLKRHRSSPVSTELLSDHGKAHSHRRRSENGIDSLKGRHGKRTRKSVSHSRSRKSSPTSSRSSSTSGSSVFYSSSSLRSESKSPQLSLKPKSRSRSRSSSPASLSLSDSLGQPLSSPPNKTEVKLNSSLDISTSPQTKLDSMQEREPLEIVSEEDNIICGNAVVAEQSEAVLMQEKKQSEIDTGVAIQDEIMDVCVDVEDDAEMDNLQNGDDNNPAEPRISSDGDGQYTASLEKECNDAGDSSPRVLGDESELQTLCDRSYLSKKSDSKISTTRAKYTSISLDELDRVMKHYHLKHTVENGGYLSTEDYFGCARSWPWEIIYYRRLKKGPISTENYARRLAQNKEFGITDKYIRSSSGWWEPTQ